MIDQVTADAELSKVISTLDILYDSPAVLAELRRLVVTHSVMNINGVKDIVTFNTKDFTRYPGITVHDPAGGVPRPPAP